MIRTVKERQAIAPESEAKNHIGIETRASSWCDHMNHSSRALALGMLCAALLFPRYVQGDQACNAVTIGLDPSQGLNSAEVFDPLGDLTGQTFYVSDTLLRSLSVWWTANQDTNIWGVAVVHR